MIYPAGKKLGNREVWVWVSDENPQEWEFFLPQEEIDHDPLRVVVQDRRRPTHLVRGGTKEARFRLLKKLLRRGIPASMDTDTRIVGIDTSMPSAWELAED